MFIIVDNQPPSMENNICTVSSDNNKNFKKQNKNRISQLVSWLCSLVMYIFCSYSQLNGNNGSWTNTDDVDNAARVRMKKEAETNRHHKNPGAKQPPPVKERIQKPCRDFVNGNCTRGDRCKFLHIAVNGEPLQVKQPEEEYIPSEHRLFSPLYGGHEWDGKTIVSVIFKELRHAEIVHGDPDKEGNFTFELLDPRPPLRLFSERFLTTFEAFQQKFELNRKVIYSELLLREIYIKLRVPVQDLRNYSAVRRFLFTAHLNCPIEVLEGTLIAYAYSESKFNRGVADIATTQSVCLLIKDRITNGTLTELEPDNNNMPNDWLFNGRWSILRSVGFNFNFVRNRGLINTYPTFATPHNDKPKYRVFVFCRFLGKAANSYYEVNGFNFTSASSRLFKCRKNDQKQSDYQLECDLYANQLKLLQHSLDHDHVLSLAGAEVQHEGELKNLKCKFGEPYPIKRDLYSSQMGRLVMASTDRFRARAWETFLNSLYKLGQAVYDFQSKTIKYTLYNTEVYISNLWNKIYSPIFHVFDRLEWISLVVQLPAPKQKLYQQWVINKGEDIIRNTFTWTSKLKREPGKFGKAARLYASADWNCLYDTRTPEVYKKIHQKPFHIHDVIKISFKWTQYFSNAADAKSSDELYKKVHELPINSVLYVYYGDDGFVAFRDVDGVLRLYETDIASCDASTGPAVFCILHERVKRLSSLENADVVVKKCTYGTKFINPSNEEQSVELVPQSFFEYSGWEHTTDINSDGSQLLGFAWCLYFTQERDLKIAIAEGSRAYGWEVTCDLRPNLNSMTFLKRAYSVRSHKSWLVYGCIFRSLGVCDSMMSHTSFNLTLSEYLACKHADLFEIHLKQRAQSYVNEPGSILLNALRRRAGVPESPELISVEDLIERYGGFDYEYLELSLFIYDLKLGDVISCSALDRIMDYDYGVK